MADKFFMPEPDGSTKLYSSFTAWEKLFPALLIKEKPKVHTLPPIIGKKRKETITEE